ncbi:MAG: protein kinase [Pyrinomonadaceae bacterium]
MEVKDWQRTEGIFHAARSLDAGERAAHLDLACAGDEALRAEVESLLAAFERRADFLEDGAFSTGLRILSTDQTESLVGRQIGTYRILSQLGRGGMGEVYLAEDTRLGRKVALKFISGKLMNDTWAKRQLVKEAQAVAMVEHPNICSIHGLEEAEGHTFIVMQYIEGETLADLIRARTPDAAEAVSLALQIVAAVAEAHAHGIIHRDLKPHNIVVNDCGQVKVLDFGLAKIIQNQGVLPLGEDSSRFSQGGLVIGTVAYMSPEQLRAEKLDFRSDIFSLGTVLYELFTGLKPFARASDAEIISAILTSPPSPLARHAHGIPPELGHIVFKCLEKDREKRYQSSSELLYDLGNIRRQRNGAASRRRSFNLSAVAALALLLLIVVVSVLAYRHITRPYTLAVLPITNESDDAGIEYLGDSLAESLINKLARLPELRVKPFTAVSGYKSTGSDPQKVGRELAVDAVLLGKIVREGHSFVLEMDLVDASDGAKLWAKRYDTVNTAAISELQNDIAVKVAAGLELPQRGSEQRLLAAHDTENEDAYREYFRGRYLWRNRNKENIQKAVEKFNAAIALDASFAKAHAGLADCYVLMNSPAYGNMPTEEAMNRAKAAAKDALELDESLPEAHTSLGVVHLKYDWNWTEAESRFRRAISLDPDYAPAHYWYSHLLTITGRQSEAITESELARKLDPLSPLTRMNYCREFYFGRQFDRAATCLNEILAEDPSNVSAQRTLGFVYLQKGMNDAAIEIFEKIPETNRALKVVALGYAYARAGRRAEAFRILAEVEEMSRNAYIPPHERAVIYLGLDDKDHAFAWLNRACDEHFAAMIYLTVDPAFNVLRQDARFAELARRLNLPSPPPA